jgi:hypothetical protein
MSLSKYSRDEMESRSKLNQAFPLYPVACERIAEEITRIDGLLYRDALLKMANENVQQRKSIELFFREVNSKQIMANNRSYFSMFTEMWKTRKDRVSVEPIVQNVNALKQRIVSADDDTNDKPKKKAVKKRRDSSSDSSEKPKKRSSKKRRDSSDEDSSSSVVEKPKKRSSKKHRDSSEEESSSSESSKNKKKASKKRRDSSESSGARKTRKADVVTEPVKQESKKSSPVKDEVIEEEKEIKLTEVPVEEEFSSN